MAIFGWGKSQTDATGDKSAGTPDGEVAYSPEKARKFFERAETLHTATSYAYAMNLWLRGLRFDPGSMQGVEGFFRSAGAFMNADPDDAGKKSVKDTAREFGGRSALDRYLHSMLDWSVHPVEAAYAVKAMQSAEKLGLREQTAWLGERALAAAARDKKPKKDHFVAIMQTLAKAERFDLAVMAGEQAVRMDPTDARLAADVKNMSAEDTTRRGGFDQTGQEGGFRKNIRDAARQRQLEERERVVTTEESLDRLVAAARADYETTPNDRPNTLKYLEVLQRRAHPEDEETALAVAAKAHEHFQEYRFREIIDTIRVRQLRRKVSRLKALADQPDATDEARQQSRAALTEFLRAEIASLEGQVAAYPTELNRKFELAKRYFQAKRYEPAIGLLQEAKAEPKNRNQALYYLGLSFQQIGWNDEAIETLRQAIAAAPEGDDKARMELQYGLMEALLARAAEQSAPTDADEAYRLASAIAIENINFKQIRVKRDEIKALLARLKGSGGGGGSGAGA